MFRGKFGEAPQTTVAVPARLELVGHHLDYLEGPTWCGAANIYNVISLSIEKASDLNAHGTKITLYAIGSEGESHDVETFLADTDNARDIIKDPDTDPIMRYVIAVLVSLKELLLEDWPLEMKIAMKLNIPYGAGLGSSAALCLGVIEAYHLLTGEFERYSYAGSIAHACEIAEHVAGASCGALDMTAELSAKANSIGVFDPGKEYNCVLRDVLKLTSEYKFVLLNIPSQKHNNRGSGLNDLIKEHDDLAKAIFEAEPGMVEHNTALCCLPEPILANPPASLTFRQRDLLRRSISEHKLVNTVTNMANAFTLTPERLGSLFNKSFENSCVLGNVTDLQKTLHFIATRLKGVHGAKIHGAGFGGVMLLLVDPNVFGDEQLHIIHDFLNFGSGQESYGNWDLEVYEINLVEGLKA